jgi:hypothetical protein
MIVTWALQMAEIKTKTEFSAMLGVKQAAISNWIWRQKLTAPALTADGRVNVELALAQLGRTIDPVAQASSRARRGSPTSPTSSSADGADWSPSAQASAQLLRARALSASVDAERKRRDLMAERGKYLLAAQAEADWARVLTALLQNVELSLADLALSLGLDREKTLALRRWWRNLRLGEAEQHRIAAAAEPQFVADAIA